MVIEGFKPINRPDQSKNKIHQGQQAESQRNNELKKECNQLKIQISEVEKTRQATTERIAKLEADYSLLKDVNKRTDNNHHDASINCKKWKDRYLDQQEEMKVLQQKHDRLEDRLHKAHTLSLKKSSLPYKRNTVRSNRSQPTRSARCRRSAVD